MEILGLACSRDRAGAARALGLDLAALLGCRRKTRRPLARRLDAPVGWPAGRRCAAGSPTSVDPRPRSSASPRTIPCAPSPAPPITCSAKESPSPTQGNQKFDHEAKDSQSPRMRRGRGGGRNRPSNVAFRLHPPGETGLARHDDGIALNLIAESPKQVIKLVIHPGNPGSIALVSYIRRPVHARFQE